MEKPEFSAQKGTRMRWFALRPWIVIISLLLIGLIFLLNKYVPRSLEVDQTETMAIGDEIVKALDNYFGDHSRYPNSLESLVPNYLDQIKLPKWGEKWEYKSDEKSFWLEVGYKSFGSTKNYPVMYYTPQGWVVDQ